MKKEDIMLTLFVELMSVTNECSNGFCLMIIIINNNNNNLLLFIKIIFL